MSNKQDLYILIKVLSKMNKGSYDYLKEKIRMPFLICIQLKVNFVLIIYADVEESIDKDFYL